MPAAPEASSVHGVSFDVAGEAYDRFMGRYSGPLAHRLADWLDVTPGQRAIDVGCGPGALTGELVDRLGADRVSAVDPSEPFVEACRERHPGVDVRQGVAESLPYEDHTFDVAASNLVVHFLQDAVAGMAEMARVTRPGCRIGATVWDLAGNRAPMAPVWAAIADLGLPDTGAGPLPGGAPGELDLILAAAGLTDVEGIELEVTLTHPTFEEWWMPFQRGVGPVGVAIAGLDPSVRARLEDALRDRLGPGPFDITATAFAVRGRV